MLDRLTEQSLIKREANTGSADLQIGGSQVRMAVSHFDEKEDEKEVCECAHIGEKEEHAQNGQIGRIPDGSFHIVRRVEDLVARLVAATVRRLWDESGHGLPAPLQPAHRKHGRGRAALALIAFFFTHELFPAWFVITQWNCRLVNRRARRAAGDFC